MSVLLFLRRFWKPIAGALAVFALLLLYRAQLAEARDRGRAECEAAEQIARQKWRDEYDKRRAELDAADEQRRDTYERETAPIRERIILEVAARPDGACLSADAERLLEAQRQAANRQLATASGERLQTPAE